MKIIVLGASGIIGREITSTLKGHEVITAGLHDGDILVDYTDTVSVRKMFETVCDFDGLICVVGGDSAFKQYTELTDADYEIGFKRKFLAQTNLIRMGINYINDGGSFTLSSGFLSHYPNPFSVATGPFNAAVDAFVTSTAPLLPRKVRINVVSPAPVVSAEKVREGLVTASHAAQYYIKSLEGNFTGQILRAWGGLENKPIW